MKNNLISLKVVFCAILALFTTSTFAAVELLPSYRGWSGCYKISNENCEVIIAASAGGRVVYYALDGENVIQENRDLDGVSGSELVEKMIAPDGGRFDIGPEATEPEQRQALFAGEWRATIISDYSVEVCYDKKNAHGVSVTRRYTLAKGSSKLEIDQTMTNQTSEPITRHYWGRAFFKPGGIITLPLDSNGNWGSMAPNGLLGDAHAVGKEIVCSVNSPKVLKLGSDSQQGWLKYEVNGIRVVQNFKCDKKGDYSETMGYTTVFYSDQKVCEMEPIGASIKMKPGESSTFSQTWTLSRY